MTRALDAKEVGDIIGFRGPYGNDFPIEDFFGNNVVFIAGGIALPPVRSVIWNVLDLRDKFEEVTIVYGARTVADLVYKHELDEWEKRDDVKLVTTVDPGGETETLTPAIREAFENIRRQLQDYIGKKRARPQKDTGILD